MHIRFRWVAMLVVALFSVRGVFAGSVDIWAFKTVAGTEYSARAAYFSVKLCRTGTQICTYGGTTDTYGKGTVNIGPSFSGWYDLYLYKNYGVNYGGEWGSQNQPLPGGAFYIPEGFTSITVSVAPRPLPPGLVAPCNYCSVYPGNFYLKWTDGLDGSRRTPVWPVTYEIWGSTTPVGWPTQPERLLIPDAPCNPDAQGKCRWYIDALDPESGRRHTWRIVVKLWIGGNVVYTTSGPSWNLVQY
jgi:hypothetical protein